MRNLSGLFLFVALAQAQPKHLIVIGVDGLGGAALQNASTPRLHQLMNRIPVGSGKW